MSIKTKDVIGLAVLRHSGAYLKVEPTYRLGHKLYERALQELTELVGAASVAYGVKDQLKKRVNLFVDLSKMRI